MLNPYVVRKYIAYILLTTIPMCAIVFGIVTYGFNNGMLIGVVSVLLASVIGNRLLNTPFRPMLEGKGLLTVCLDSTGVMDFQILGIQNGRIKGWLFGKDINIPYDQNLIHTLYTPKTHTDGAYVDNGDEVKAVGVVDAEGKVTPFKKDADSEFLVIDMRKFRKFRFGFNQYPVLVYNKVTKTLLTKEFIGGAEKSLASHLVFVANERAKDLANSMSGFSRAVVDAEAQKGGSDWSKWIMYVIIGLGVAFVIYMLIKGGGGIGGAITGALGNVGGVINPQ